LFIDRGQLTIEFVFNGRNEMPTRLLIFCAILALTTPVFGQSKSTLQGVWRVAEVTTTGPNASTNKSPQPGVYIFTAKHYSFVRDTASEVRPAIKAAANITPAEAVATLNPFFAQSGTYEVSGSTLKTTSIVALRPPQQGKYGGSNTWSFKLQGDTLWVTQALARETPVPNPATIRLTRIE
jgi:hypothetical protein